MLQSACEYQKLTFQKRSNYMHHSTLSITRNGPSQQTSIYSCSQYIVDRQDYFIYDRNCILMIGSALTKAALAELLTKSDKVTVFCMQREYSVYTAVLLCMSVCIVPYEMVCVRARVQRCCVCSAYLFVQQCSACRGYVFMQLWYL